MTNWYVRSGATGTGVGTSWGNAAVSMSALMALATKPLAGDRVFAAHDHDCNYAVSATITWPGGPAPVEVYSVDDTANYASTSHAAPDSSKLTAKPTTTTQYARERSAGPALDIRHDGFFYMHGITLAPIGMLYLGDANTAHGQAYENCLLRSLRGSSGTIFTGNAGTLGQTVRFVNTGLDYASAAADGGLKLKCQFEMLGGAVSGTLGTTFLSAASAREHTIVLDGVDLSILGSGKYIAEAGYQASVAFVGCLLGVGVALANTSSRPPNFKARLVSCDVAGGNVQRHEQALYAGDMARDSAIYRTGSAGNQSVKVRSNAKASTAAPMRVLVGRYGFEDTANKTITAYVAQKTGKTRATNKELWLEALPSVTASPQQTLITSRATSPLHAAADLTTDASSSWNGLTTPVLSTISLSLTTAAYRAGAVDIYLCAGKNFSGTDDEVYVDVAVA